MERLFMDKKIIGKFVNVWKNYLECIIERMKDVKYKREIKRYGG